MGFNLFTGSLQVGGCQMGGCMDIDGNYAPPSTKDWNKLYDEDEDGTTFQQPPLSERQQQERAERIAQIDAEIQAKRRDMLIYALAVMIGFFTLLIASAFF